MSRLPFLLFLTLYSPKIFCEANVIPNIQENSKNANNKSTETKGEDENHILKHALSHINSTSFTEAHCEKLSKFLKINYEKSNSTSSPCLEEMHKSFELLKRLSVERLKEIAQKLGIEGFVDDIKHLEESKLFKLMDKHLKSIQTKIDRQLQELHEVKKNLTTYFKKKRESSNFSSNLVMGFLIFIACVLILPIFVQSVRKMIQKKPSSDPAYSEDAFLLESNKEQVEYSVEDTLVKKVGKDNPNFIL